ncbi:CopG family transcriptional regulator [Thiomonas sp.]|jgi:hypothetical protein|uniref:CopG family transcriptional regulator n=1 Tax=Thiomonas sp. TaxID=2047785 RepID=UPI00260C68DB|nr:CopG family transcriptional regulator [Thiomonas sp.]
MEQRTTRLTVLIDPRKKEVFEHVCAREDQTPSQVVRRLIRDYIEQRLGRPWQPGESLEELRGQWPAPPAQTDPADESR